MTDRQSLTPQEAKEGYSDSRKTELSESTTRAHKYHLSPFVRLREEEGIERVTELSGRHFDRYKIWRRETGDLNNATLTTRLSTVRAFSKWTESVDAVPKGTHEHVTPPSMAPKKTGRRSFSRTRPQAFSVTIGSSSTPLEITHSSGYCGIRG